MARQIKLHFKHKWNREPWCPEAVLRQALGERAAFLLQHSKQALFQSEIDRIRDKAGDQENRLTVVALLMEAKLVAPHYNLLKLNGRLLRAAACPRRP